jgi:uncharacterized membrane protein YgdD (TMEM256/DUF423 family)
MSDDKEAADVRHLQQWASFLGATGVGLGALGAHALQAKLVQRNMLEPWRTAILYQLVHATAMLGVSALAAQAADDGSERRDKLTRAGQFMGAGSVLFSGSIYLLCFGIGPKRIVGPTTPIGGLFLLYGWITLGLS